MRSWEGGDALSERFPVKGSDGVGCAEGAGDEEVDFAIATCWRSRMSGVRGASGEGSTVAILLEAEGANGEGAAESVTIGVAFSAEGNARDAVGSGADFTIGSIPCTCGWSSVEVARTRSSGTGRFNHWAVQSQFDDNSADSHA